MQEVVRQKDWLGNSKGKMMTIFDQNRLRLRVDTIGCLVVNGFEGWNKTVDILVDFYHK